MHGVAAWCVLLVLPGSAGFAVAALLGFLGIATAWSRALLRGRSSVRALELAGPGLEVQLAGGDSFAAEVKPRRYAGRYLVILPIRGAVHRTILITRDMTDADSFRRLRIWALWGKVPVAGTQLPA